MIAENHVKFKQTEVGRIPEHWEIKKLRDVAEKIFSGGTPDTRQENYWNGDLPWLSSGETRQTFIRDTEKKITRQGVSNSSTRLARKDDVVVAGAGQGFTRGQSSFCMIDTYINQSVVAVRANKERVVPLFLFYNLLSRYDELRQISDAHSSRGSLTTKLLADLNIGLPPISAQVFIAKILSDIDFKIELNQQMNKTLEAIAQAIFKHWFIDFEFPNEEGKPYKSSGGEMVYDEERDKDMPQGWKLGKVSEICSTQYGYTARALNDPVGPRFLRVTDINKAPWINWNDVPFCIIDGKSLDHYKLSIGDILISRMADPGKAAIVEDDVSAVFASYLIRLKTSSLAWAYYLFYFLRSKMYLNYVESAKGGSVQSNMNARLITSADILIPTQYAVEQFLAVVRPLRNRIVEGLHESHTLSSIRDSLLPKLMSGKIRVPVEV